MYEIISETLKIPDLNETGLAYISNMTSEGKITIEPNSKIPDFSKGREEITQNVE